MQFLTFKDEVLVGVCGFVVDICDDLAIFDFMGISKNGSSLKLCSIVDFILVVVFGIGCVIC